MVPQWIIEKKRDGAALAEGEIRAFIEGYTRGTIPDYQMAALAMAVFFRGMTRAELAVLTDAMMRSGTALETSRIPGVKADKHSTGGVGDKVSLILAPLAASCGVVVPMISGRGLGITGGTLDKLESIRGYRTDLAPDEFMAVLAECGCSIVGQTAALAPADRKLYALRDVTGTVPSIPLIAASIMCKKLAEGIDALVLDVKWGRGAFMKTPEQARELARTMVEIGAGAGKAMSALITDMNQPLGRTAGNALEVAETLEALSGRGAPDLMRVTLALTAQMLVLTGRVPDTSAARPILQAQLGSGAARRRFLEMVARHGGDAEALASGAGLPRARLRREIRAPRAGTVSAVDAGRVGRACLALGAGRTRVEDAVDHAAGISGIVKIGERVDEGQPLAALHANDEGRLDEALRIIDGAFAIGEGEARPPELIVETVRPGNG